MAGRRKSPAGTPSRPGAHLTALDPPPPREGDDCACGCGKGLPRIALEHGDPFNSAECARRWHGVSSAFAEGRGVFSQAASLGG